MKYEKTAVQGDFFSVFRHGDNGYYLFFATTGLKLSNNDVNLGKT